MHIVLIRVVRIALRTASSAKVHQPTTHNGREMTPGRVHICTRNPQPSGKVDRGRRRRHLVPNSISQPVIIQGLYPHNYAILGVQVQPRLPSLGM